LVPHVRRAAMIGKLIDATRTEAAALADTLDGLEAGMFLVDSAGRLVHANISGRAMLNDGNVLQANNKLVAHDTKADEALHDVLLAANSGDAAVGDKGISVRMAGRDGNQFVTHVLPLNSGARLVAGASYAAVAAVFVQKAGQDHATALQAVAEQYGLTPAEARVLAALMETGGVDDIASSLELSAATVRTHLRHIFEKTSVRRQADLVKLITSQPAPILGKPPRSDA
jgi:DNA-binding CsgD family transcriptional regulator